jgi:hypothetical protein
MDDKAFARAISRHLAMNSPPAGSAAPAPSAAPAGNAWVAWSNDVVASLDSLSQRIGEFADAANGLFGTAFDAIDALTARIEALETKLGALADKAPALRDKLKRVEQRVGELLASPWTFNFDRLEVDGNGKVRTISTTYEAIAKVIEKAEGFVVVRTDAEHSWIIGPAPPDFDLAPELLPSAAAPRGGNAGSGADGR